VNSNPRQLKLLNTVRTRGSVTVEQLAEMLDVTLQTVRRDVQRLADEGLLTRFHGGVRVPSSTPRTSRTGSASASTKARRRASRARSRRRCRPAAR
jgi:DeoR family glycerol-3-phosphate regulon repressor